MMVGSANSPPPNLHLCANSMSENSLNMLERVIVAVGDPTDFNQTVETARRLIEVFGAENCDAADILDIIGAREKCESSSATAARAAAAVALLDRQPSTISAAHVELSVMELLLPLVGQSTGAAANQVQLHAARLLASNGRWNAVALVFQACLGMAGEDADGRSNRRDAATVQSLPVGERVAFAAQLVQQAVLSADDTGQWLLQLAGGCGTAAALALLSVPNQSAAVRAAVGQQLLPACVQAAESCGNLGACLQLVWAACKSLLDADNDAGAQQVGLALLVQFCAALINDSSSSSSSSSSNSDHNTQLLSTSTTNKGGIRSDPEFWALLQRALLDEDSLMRKRAVHVLRWAVTQPAAGSPGGARAGAPTTVLQPWRSFLQLWDALDEFSIHLIREALPEMDCLHPPAPADSGRSGGGSSHRTPMLEWGWMEVLWKRGLTHCNLQAQRLVALSFLGRDWPNAYLRTLPVSFVVGHLLPALGQPHMEARQGEGSQADVFRLAPAFVGRYAAALDGRQQQRELLLALLGLLIQRGLTRVLVQLAAEGAAATTQAARLASTSSGGSSSSAEEGEWGTALLAAVTAATRAQRSIGSGAYALAVLQGLLSTATGSVSLSDASQLLAGGRWLHLLPLPLLQPGGALRDEAATWLAASCQACLPAVVAAYLDRGSSSSSSSNGSAAPSDDEVKAWQVDAAGIARLLLLQQDPGDSGPEAQAVPAARQSRAAMLVSTALDPLALLLCGLYRRPHQLHSSARLALLLLQELLLAVEPLPGGLQGRQQVRQHNEHQWMAGCPLQAWLEQLLARGSTVEELCSYSKLMADSAFFQRALCQLPPSSVEGETDRDATALAVLGVGCTAHSLRFILRGPCDRRMETWHALRQLNDALAHFLRAVCRPEASSSGGNSSASCGVPRLPASSAAQMLGLTSDVARALASAAAEPGATAGYASSDPQQQPFHDTEQAMQAVLQHQAAAAALEAAAGLGDVPARDTLARYQRLSWYAAAGLLQLQAQLEHCGAVQPLTPGLQAQLLAAVVAALQAAKRDIHSLTPQLHCLRSLLPALLCSTQRGGSGEIRQPPAVLQEPVLCAAVGCSGRNGAGVAAVLRWAYAAAWAAVKGAAKHRRGPLLATFVSTCLHPALFAASSPDDPRLALHAPGGPVQWLLGHLFALGHRSARVMTLVSLQLCGLLAVHPLAALRYCEGDAGGSSGRDDIGRAKASGGSSSSNGTSLMQQLVLFGYDNDAVAAAGAAGNEVAWEAGAAAELAAVMPPTDPQLAAAFAATELAPRVTAVCMFAQWVAAAEAGDEAAAAAGTAAWHLLLGLAVGDPELGSTKYVQLGTTHRRKIRLWQALCVLSPLLTPLAAGDALGPLLSTLTTNVASVSQFQEAAILQLVVRQPSLLSSRILPLLRDYRSAKAEYSPFLILVAAQAAVLLQPTHHPLHPSTPEHQGTFDSPADPAPSAAARQQPVASGSCDGGRAAEQRKQECLEWERLLRQVAVAVAPWALTHPHHTRSFAQLVLWRLFEVWPSLLVTDPTSEALWQFLSTNEDVARLRRATGAEHMLTGYNLVQAASPAGVFCKGVALVGQQEDKEVRLEGLEGAPAPLLDVVTLYLLEERHKLRQRMAAELAESAQADMNRATEEQRQMLRQPGRQAQPVAAAAEAPPAKAGVDATTKGAEAQVEVQAQRQQQQQGANWQRKITPLDKGLEVANPWVTALGLPMLAAANDGGANGLGSDNPAEDDASAAARQLVAGRGSTAARQQLVVCASLVDRVPNLAGLARTCEVFRASSLVVASKAVTRVPGFTSISVTAEAWLPMEEVPELSLPSWLRSKAALGYTLVGLEQTAESASLPSFDFPPKTVLLLGREKEGIPADLLGLLHYTVEIPQLGLIRSLNVHVSGAIAIYEYTRQAQAGNINLQKAVGS